MSTKVTTKPEKLLILLKDDRGVVIDEDVLLLQGTTLIDALLLESGDYLLLEK